MLRPVRNFKPAQALPRMLADFINVHLCMMGALATPVFYLAALRHENARAATRLADAMAYYSSSFMVLSLLFPLVFLLNGFYTHSRGYVGRYKKFVILRGVCLSVLLFLAANFIFFRRTMVPRSVLLVFCGMAMFSLGLSRLVKGALSDQFEIRPKGKEDPPPERLVLVLGGAGYIGSVLVRKLLEAGRRVRVLDSLVYGDSALRDILRHPKLELKLGDCRKIQDVVGAVKGADSIVHLAAIVGDPACEVDRQTSLQINYAATRMLIEVARGNGIRHFVFASSCSVYGASDLLMDENSHVQPVSLYGQTKVDSEEALLETHADGFCPVILRLATVFGLSYRHRFDLVVNLLTAKACKEGAITVCNGTQWRPFIHVGDVAVGIAMVLDAPLSVLRGEIFNLGDTRMNHQLSEVANKILAVFPTTKVVHMENSDRRNYRVSFDKIRHQLGFECTLGLEHGIQELRRALEEKQVLDYRDASYYNEEFLRLLGSPSCKDELDLHVMAAFANAPTSARSAALLMAQAAASGR
jgi:nucleoside-diphosphate-sugar epimerase